MVQTCSKRSCLQVFNQVKALISVEQSVTEYNVESTIQTNREYTNDYLFIYFAQNKRTVRFQCTRQAGTARLKTLTQHKTKKI